MYSPGIWAQPYTHPVPFFPCKKPRKGLLGGSLVNLDILASFGGWGGELVLEGLLERKVLAEWVLFSLWLVHV